MEKVDRLVRVNELIKREIAGCLESGRLLMPEGSLISITEVKSSVDLRSAEVFFSVFGGGDAAPMTALRALNRQRIELQDAIGRNLKFKHTPKLKFTIDDRMAEADRVLRLLDGTDNNSEKQQN
ncbi:MAG: 30S ribosome-binding factor RbfA [Victivallaceae bacterium]|nr:30S ribosome-binding factor RbfA [Victivallaceae bacterium]